MICYFYVLSNSHAWRIYTNIHWNFSLLILQSTPLLTTCLLKLQSPLFWQLPKPNIPQSIAKLQKTLRAKLAFLSAWHVMSNSISIFLKRH